MTRRMFDSALWMDYQFGTMPMEARLLWFGLVSSVDDQGRMPADADRLKEILLPFRDTPTEQMESFLLRLEKSWHLQIYEVDSQRYMQVTDWWKTQKIRLPLVSDYPPPPDWEDKPGYMLGEKLYSGDWPIARKKALERDGYQCVECGDPEPLEVHHIVPVRMGGIHDVGFLVTLCRTCHRQLHSYINKNGLTKEAVKWLVDVS